MHNDIRVRLLGPVTVSGPVGPLAVGGRRAQRLLATLALSPGRSVAVPALIDAAWPDRPPATCRDQVNNCLSGLRRQFAAGGADPLRRTPTGFELCVPEDRIDAYAFERAVAGHRPHGDAAGEARRLRAALALWTGDALGGIAEGPLAVDAARLDEMRLAAYEELFGLATQTPAAPGLSREIAALARRHPLRERLTQHLMTALHLAGRPAEALHAYEQHRRALRAEIGVEPDAVLRSLAVKLRRERAAAATPAPGEPLSALLAQLSTLAREIAWRLESEA